MKHQPQEGCDPLEGGGRLLQEHRVTHFLVTALSTCSCDSRSSLMPT